MNFNNILLKFLYKKYILINKMDCDIEEKKCNTSTKYKKDDIIFV